MRIVINCDDLGANAAVNESIFALMEQACVTSATLMMNGPAIKEAIRRIGKFPHCSFGVHLNVTEFAPLSAHAGLRPLLDGKGEFAGRTRRDPVNIPLTNSIREGVYAEWSAQIERALAFGVPVSHADSHHHVHTRASLLPVLRAVVKKYDIPRVRLRRNLLADSRSPRKRLRVARQMPWIFAMRLMTGASTTDAFASFADFYARLQSGHSWNGSVELMCHPGSERFRTETELLMGDWRQRFCPEAKLISYNDI